MVGSVCFLTSAGAERPGGTGAAVSPSSARQALERLLFALAARAAVERLPARGGHGGR